ncbi:MAG: glucose-6-phosphate dehydrogenase assembly protein OpcA [Planctomycetes bacterium]|nr:glucose-6-phosphate dehydrogenase assembly protein OpcA [Planctomycetota bacterium]
MSHDTIELQGFAGGNEIEVPCDKIDAELDAIWRGIAKRSRIAVHRACLLNVVIHAGDGPSEIVARFLATSLTERIPARVILIRARPDEPGDGPPRAFVSASRVASAEIGDVSRSSVAGEIVLLDARGSQLDRVPAVVRATLEPDLATTLWWTGPVPRPRAYVAELRDLADRVVIDTEDLPDDVDASHLLPAAGDVTRAAPWPVEGALGVASAGGAPTAAGANTRSTPRGKLADLAWPRLAPWRTALARAFDEPSHREFLRAIDTVRIGVGAPRGKVPAASAAPLLAGWLATALRWRPCVRSGDREVCFPSPDALHDAHVTIEPRDGEWRGVVDVELAAPGPNGTRNRLVVRRTSQGTVECEVPAGFRPVRPAPFRDVDPVDVLAAALLEIHADPVAPEAIRRGAELAAALCAG